MNLAYYTRVTGPSIGLQASITTFQVCCYVLSLPCCSVSWEGGSAREFWNSSGRDMPSSEFQRCVWVLNLVSSLRGSMLGVISTCDTAYLVGMDPREG